ncbi:MAG: phage portal protein [Phycisphaerales bacterium]
MSYRLGAFADVGLTQARLTTALDEHGRSRLARFERWWAYYRNALAPAHSGGRWYRQPQEVGLPGRLRGVQPGGGLRDDRAGGQREIVIENDIAWRVQAMVDFMFGKPVVIRSAAREALRPAVEHALSRVWGRSGGVALLQDAALMGHVFGHVDLLVRVDEDAMARAALLVDKALPAAADAVRIEAVEPRRGVPVLSPHDFRRMDAYLIHARTPGRDRSGEGLSLRAVLRAMSHGWEAGGELLEVISPGAWHVYENGRLVWEQSRAWTGGALPVVHIQNISQPLEYEGLGEVEPLIPLQDELNTRISDRACRVTMQSFKMYLAKGIEGLTQVGPGQVWHTDNTGASVESFGGDAHSPSEEAHIREVREALDKVSSVPPLSGGVVQGRIGNLSSATALRITLMGLSSKTARKRVTYGRGISDVCALVLAVLNTAGVLTTGPEDRAVTLEWPDPFPDDIRDTPAPLRGTSDGTNTGGTQKGV